MKKTVRIAFFIILLMLMSCNQTSKKDAITADIIYFGGDIITMEGNQPIYAEVIVVKDGKIIFVGKKTESDKLKGENTILTNLEGKTLLPGF